MSFYSAFKNVFLKLCEYFCCSYLDESMLYLLSCLRRDRERSAAFQAIGLLAISVHDGINKHLPKVMEFIRSSLPSKDMPQKYVTFGYST